MNLKGKGSQAKNRYNRELESYKWFVVDLKENKAITGYEFKSDALDILSDYDNQSRYKVVSEISLKKLGIENPKEMWKYKMAIGGNIPYDLKVTGIYTFKTISGKEYKFAIIGFEREDDTEWAFYFSDWNREENNGLRSVIVKNSAIRKMAKGETVTATTKAGEKGKLTKVGDSFMGMPKMAKGGGVGNENAQICYSIGNDSYGSLELGFYDISFKNEKRTITLHKSFYKMDDAFSTLFDYLKGEDGKYIMSNDPKSNFYIEEYSYDGKSIDADGNIDLKFKKIFKISAKRLKELISSNNFKKGGYLANENALMVSNNNKQISHHTKEMSEALKGAKNVPAWVVAKVNRSASDLSDATHYLEGAEGMYADGGVVSYDIVWQDKDGDEYSESFDTIEEVNDLIKNIKKNGGRIIEKLKYIDNDFKGYFADGGETRRKFIIVDEYTNKVFDKEFYDSEDAWRFLRQKFDNTDELSSYSVIDTLDAEKYYADGGGVENNLNKKYLNSIPEDKKQRILRNVADHYGISIKDAEKEVTDIESEALYEYITNESLRMEVYNDMENRKLADGGIEDLTPVELYFRNLDYSKLPESFSNFIKTEILTDPELKYLSEREPIFIEIKEKVEKYENQNSGKVEEAEEESISDLIAGLEVLVPISTKKEKKELLDLIEGLKLLL